MKRSHLALVETLAVFAGSAAVAGVAFAWWSRRSVEPQATLGEPGQPALEQAALSDQASSAGKALQQPTPARFELPAAPPTEEPLTARPRGEIVGTLSLDDCDALGADELGQAFLAGATDTVLDEPPRSTADELGFHIVEEPDGEYQEEQEEADEEETKREAETRGWERDAR